MKWHTPGIQPTHPSIKIVPLQDTIHPIFYDTELLLLIFHSFITQYNPRIKFLILLYAKFGSSPPHPSLLTCIITQPVSKIFQVLNLRPCPIIIGQIVDTPSVLCVLIETEQNLYELLLRIMTGDWGDLDEEDKKENDMSLERGIWIFSAYKLESGVKIWVITEWDRSAATILLPSVYWFSLYTKEGSIVMR